MPSFKGLTVSMHVQHPGKYVKLDEHRVQRLERRRLTSAFVPSSTNMPFIIGVEVETPIALRNWKDMKYQAEVPSGSGNVVEFKKLPPLPVTLLRGIEKRPPFDLVVEVFIDGQAKPELRGLVPLNKANPTYGKELCLAGRTIRDAAGKPYLCSWVFRDVGVETMLDRLMLSEEQAGAKRAKQTEDELINAMDTFAFDGHNHSTNAHLDRGAPGQVVVIFRRIVMIEGLRMPKPGETSGCNNDDGMPESPTADKDVSHLTGLTQKKRERSKDHTVSSFREFADDEVPYATFKFFYRESKIIERMDHMTRATAGGSDDSGSNASISPPAMLNKRSFEEGDGKDAKRHKQFVA